MNASDFEQIALAAARTKARHWLDLSDCWSAEQQPATYYRTVAARARRLQAHVTTPGVKQHLDNMIAHCERLAGKIELR